MKPSVYLETSFVSYATADDSSNARTQFRIELSREWWARQSDEFELYISETVLFECLRGDSQQIQRRKKLLEMTAPLVLTEGVNALASVLRAPHLIPSNAANDSLHIAFATFYECQYLLTWNFKHIFNGHLIPKISHVLQEQGYAIPFICTPESLFG